MELDPLHLFLLLIVCILFGYILIPIINRNNTNDVQQEALRNLIDQYKSPRKNRTKLQKEFALDYGIYLPLKQNYTLNQRTFERCVKSKGKWNEWCLYKQTVNDHFNGNAKAFLKSKSKTIREAAKYLSETLEQLRKKHKQVLENKVADEFDKFEDETEITEEPNCLENYDQNTLMNKIKESILLEVVNNVFTSKPLLRKSSKNVLGFIKHINKNKNTLNNLILTFNVPKVRGRYANLANENKYVLSCDLVTANFQTMKFLDPLLVKNCDNYYDFISHFTKFDCFKNSKKIRQVIFGKSNARMQQYIERCFMAIIMNEIKFNDIVCFLSADEVVYNLSADNNEREKQIKNVRNVIDDIVMKKYHINVRLEIWKLKVLNRKRKWFVKEYIEENGSDYIYKNGNKKIKFVSVPGKYYLRCYNYVFGREENILCDRVVEEANGEIKLLMNSVDLEYKM